MSPFPGPAADIPDDPAAHLVAGIPTDPAARLVAGIVVDPAARLVAIGVREPDGLALIDSRSGVVRARIALPGRLWHLDLATPGAGVLVADESSGSLITIALPGCAVLATVEVGTFPRAATVAGDGTFAVADDPGGAFAFMRDGKVIHRFTNVTHPGGIAVVGDVVAVGGHELSHYRDTGPTRVEAGDGPSRLIADRRGHLLVVDTRGGRVHTYEIAPRLRRIGSTSLPGTPSGVAYDSARDRLWVTLTDRDEVVGLDLGAGTPTVAATVPAVRRPHIVAVDSTNGRLFIAGRTDATVHLVDPPAF